MRPLTENRHHKSGNPVTKNQAQQHPHHSSVKQREAGESTSKQVPESNHNSQHNGGASVATNTSVVLPHTANSTASIRRSSRTDNSQPHSQAQQQQGKVKRGSFSLQSSSSSYKYVFEPLSGSESTANQISSSRDIETSFPSLRRRMEAAHSRPPIPMMVKINGHQLHHNGMDTSAGNATATMNGYTSRHGASGISTPSTDSFHSSPVMSPKFATTNGCIINDDVSICSSDSFSSERFYVNEHVDMTPASSSASLAGSESEEHPFFSGLKDVRNPDSLQEMKIVSARGTIRGIKNRVRGGIATFVESKDGKPVKNYRALEKEKIVFYTTSMMIVRDTHEKCKKMKHILQTHMVEHEERDIFMSKENQKELQERLGNSWVDVPQVFVDGQHLGGADEIINMNESGELRRIFRNYKKRSHGGSCDRCGGYRYIPCLTCHGSRKSLHRNHFTEEFCALRCIICDENGLVRCDVCHSTPASEGGGSVSNFSVDGYNTGVKL